MTAATSFRSGRCSGRCWPGGGRSPVPRPRRSFPPCSVTSLRPCPRQAVSRTRSPMSRATASRRIPGRDFSPHAISSLPRTSSFAFKDKAEDVRAIGEKLGVRSVLEGSVRQAGGRLRVTAQLIDVTSGYQLWSERVDRTLDDIFAVQDEIARAIAGTLRVRLLGESSAPRAAVLRDPAAFDLYLKGRFFFNRRSPKQAIEAFEAALARDPAFAAAYTGLADAWGIHGFYGGIDTRVAFARARTAVEQAKALAPDAPEVAMSFAIQEHYFGWDFAHEERELHAAQEAAPQLAAPHYWLGIMYGLQGRLDEARPFLERFRELEPFNPC